ncbi:Pyrrolo-quinoline quinone [Novosphingobium nitrogenifigens DSM 19370]|uniref:Pyrrolo-quinoline quinone n=1 Tax=Novosphingobium nitrogenifigens DSM 19370 TaxID=983920 RepID=F1Z6X6_9SPHN|nr:PQQ-binding-like beta-propeller repeat protein [Novosphingobium nitrogenifigens]EGD59786.1 Pyrrolo-quinoline quinone [Novosphingobium nitrogenifigens DSM 19370]
MTGPVQTGLSNEEALMARMPVSHQTVSHEMKTRFLPAFAAPRRALATVAIMGIALALGACSGGAGKHKVKTTPTVGTRVPILSRIEAGTKVDDAMAGISVVLPPPEVNSDWTQGGGSASKAYGHLALADHPHKLWSTLIAGSSPLRRLAAAPVIGNGKLFVMDTLGVLRALDANTGRELWHQDFVLPDSGSSVFGGGASYDDGVVYVTTGLGEVAALDAEKGTIKWRVKPLGPLRGSPAIGYGSVVVMTQDNQIAALNVADGATQWMQSGSLSQTGVFGVAAPAVGQGTIVAGYSSGELVAYRYENGRQLWSDALARTSIATSVSTLTDIDADPIIDHGRVYALGQGGRMAAYELVTGQRIWELNLAGISTPSVAGEWIFTLTDEGKLLCIAKSSGKVRWLTQLRRYQVESKKKGAIFWTGPVLAGNRLWVANSNGELATVSVDDGKLTRFASFDGGFSLAPVVANQTLYVLDNTGRLTAFR